MLNWFQGQPVSQFLQRCALSDDGQNFRLFQGVADIDTLPAIIDDTTFRRANDINQQMYWIGCWKGN